MSAAASRRRGRVALVMASMALTAMRREEDADLWELRDECRENPKNLPLRISLGDLLMERGDPRAALDVYREALRMKPPVVADSHSARRRSCRR